MATFCVRVFMQLCLFYLKPCAGLPDKKLMVRFAVVWCIIFVFIIDINKCRYCFISVYKHNAFVALF